MINYLLIFIVATLLVAHVGICWSGILLKPDNILAWLTPHINNIKSTYIQDLLSCHKCVSGQFALWSYVGVSIHFGIFHWFFSIMFGIAWVCWCIVIANQLYKLYKYD